MRAQREEYDIERKNLKEQLEGKSVAVAKIRDLANSRAVRNTSVLRRSKLTSEPGTSKVPHKGGQQTQVQAGGFFRR